MFRKALAISSIVAALPAAANAEMLYRQSISTEAMYDSNADFSETGQNGEDFKVMVTPGFEIASASGRLDLKVSYAPSGVYYMKDQDRNNITHSLNASVKSAISESLSLDASDVFSYSEEPAPSALQTGRFAAYNNSFRAGLNYAFNPVFSGGVMVSDSILFYENGGPDDVRTDNISLNGRYVLTQRTSVTGDYGFTAVAYSESGKAIESHSLSAGLSSDVSERSRAQLSAGASYSPDSKSLDWIGSAAISTVFQAYSLNAGINRSVSNTSGLASRLSFTDSVSASVTHLVSQASTLSLTGGYTRTKSKPSDVNMDILTAGISWTWQARSWLTVSAGYNHSRQDSKGVAGDDIERETVFVKLTASAGEWRF